MSTNYTHAPARATDMPGAAPPSTRYTIVQTRGALRRAAAAYLETHHYMRSAGGSGQLFAVLDSATADVHGAVLIGATASARCERAIAGAVLIGPTASADAERRLAHPGVLIRQIKRAHLHDAVPMYESHLLRHAMQQVCNAYGTPVLYVAYADPAATDARTGQPLLGWSYLAAGFFYAGETTSRRSCVVDHHGRARSTRQGRVTLRRATLPRAGDCFHGEPVTRDWRLVALPPARIWLAVVTPAHLTRRQARRAWRGVWAQLHPERRLAARVWISHVAWRRCRARGTVSLGEPRPQHLRAHDRFQPAWWRGAELTRTAAPVWVPAAWQQTLLDEATVAGETTAHRCYRPLAAG